jgi:hypothetical protein
MITMLLGGLWHGAGWTFVVWGGLHGFYLVVNHGWRALRGSVATERPRRTWWGPALSRVVTFLAVVIAWVFFRATSFEAAFVMLKGMTGANGFGPPRYLADVAASLVLVPALGDLGWTVSPLGLMIGVLALLLATVWLAPNTHQLIGGDDHALDPYPSPVSSEGSIAPWWRPTPAMAVLTGAVLFACLLGLLTEKPSEFLYFQF